VKKLPVFLLLAALAAVLAVIGNRSTPNLDTGFSDWFEDYQGIGRPGLHASAPRA